MSVEEVAARIRISGTELEAGRLPVDELDGLVSTAALTSLGTTSHGT